jgi:hypothetical protein
VDENVAPFPHSKENIFNDAPLFVDFYHGNTEILRLSLEKTISSKLKVSRANVRSQFRFCVRDRGATANAKHPGDKRVDVLRECRTILLVPLMRFYPKKLCSNIKHRA